MSIKIAGIVAYKPNYDRLTLNINAIYSQVDALIIYCNSIIDKSELPDGKYIWINNTIEKNDGIAHALNIIMQTAEVRGAEWCLLLDQDSIVSEDIIKSYEKVITNLDTDNIAILTPQIIDKASYVKAISNDNINIVKECITSASYNNIRIWKHLGKFREDFFIDYVDWEYCARAKKNNYKIIRVNSVILDHQLGKITYHRIFGGVLSTYNHPAFRKYYITRNTFVIHHLYPEEVDFNYPMLRTLKRMFITIAFEEDKVSKCKAIVKGIVDYRLILNGKKRM